MSHDGGVIADLNGTAGGGGGGNPGEASDVPKHGFGPADPATPTGMAGVETASIIAQPSPVVAPAAVAGGAGAGAEGESAAAPVALAAALAVNQAALDGRPLDSMSGTPVAGSDLVASPTAQPMVRCEMDERILSY